MMFIPKEKLKSGAYYEGRCRNTSLARWNGTVFVYWRYKMGEHFLDEIGCPEDERYHGHDVFLASRELKDLPKGCRAIPCSATPEKSNDQEKV